MSNQKLPLSVLRRYTGGHIVEYGGYWFELCPDHPKANPFGFVPQHRLVVERHLGRFLSRVEIVHHIDLDPRNNSLENLQVLTKAEHLRLHRRIEREQKYPPLSRQVVKDALEHGGLKAAAAALNCHQQTIRNQFPDLVLPYKRKSPAKLDDPIFVARLRVLAADDKIGYREAAKALGISVESIAHILNRENIPWKKKSRRGEEHKTYTYRRRKPSQKALGSRALTSAPG